MSADAWLTLAVVVITVAALAREVVPPPFAVLGGVTVLLAAGVIDGDQAFKGFSNEAPITVAALYVLAGAVTVTGALERLADRILGARRGGDGGGRALSRLVFSTAGVSGFLNNTPIVAMIAPAVIGWARRTGHAVSPYLMPVSFAAVLGGLLTLVGTSTNLVVSGLMTDAGQRAMGFFEIGQVGLPLAVSGLVLLIVTAPRLLPARRAPSEEISQDAREFTVEMVVAPGGPLDGSAVAEGGLRNLEGVFLVELERSGRRIAPVGPEQELLGGDRLTFAGNADRVLDLQRMRGLSSAEESHFTVAGEGPHRRFFEAVVAPGSALDGSTLKELGFRGRYGAAVVALHRAGERVPAKLGEVRLRAGDVLLLLADADFRQRWRGDPSYLVVAPLDGGTPPRREKAVVAALVTLVLFVTVGTGLVDILEGSLIAAFVLLALRVLSPTEARESVDLNVVLVIAASFGLGEAVSASGLADTISSGLVDSLGGLGDVGLLAGVLVATMALTELISNNAAAVLMFPIAIEAASGAGLDPRGFAFAVAIGASASFITPIGYQTNMMVWGMGGYRFSDFPRLGVPLTILSALVAVTVIPLAWPL